LSAFFVCIIRNRACIDDIDIGYIIKTNLSETRRLKTSANGRSFGEIEFTTKSMKRYGFSLRHKGSKTNKTNLSTV
jgi:hypothetical protein